MKSKRTRQFHELYDALPKGVQKQADKAYEMFVLDEHHPGLNFKSLEIDIAWYSVRIGINYRAVCVLDPPNWVWFWIGSHADYDKLLKQR